MIGLGLFSTAGQRLQLIHFKQNFKKKGPEAGLLS